jgi:hypothetical protein
MIRVPVKTTPGVFRTMRTRVPGTRTFALYREARERYPELIKGIYNAISRAALAHPREAPISSADLLRSIPKDGPLERSWKRFSDSEVVRNSLFEQVLWTYLFDQVETWETTWPDRGQSGARYVRLTPAAEIELPPGPPPMQLPSAATTRTRGISLEPAVTDRIECGDWVEIIGGKYKDYASLAQVSAIEMVNGFPKATLKLIVNGRLQAVGPFRMDEIRRVDPPNRAIPQE